MSEEWHGNFRLYPIGEWYSGKLYLNLSGGHGEDNTPVVLWNDDTDRNSGWDIKHVGDKNHIILNEMTATAMTSTGVGGEAYVVCRYIDRNNPTGNRNQLWKIFAQGDGVYTFEPADHPGNVLDVQGGKLKKDTRLIVFPWQNGGNQKWKIGPQPD